MITQDITEDIKEVAADVLADKVNVSFTFPSPKTSFVKGYATGVAVSLTTLAIVKLGGKLMNKIKSDKNVSETDYDQNTVIEED